MEYKPRLPKSNSNVSHQSPVKDFITLLTGVVAIIIVVYFLLGLLIDQTAQYISPKTEAEFFVNFENALQPKIEQGETTKLQIEQWQQVLYKIQACAEIGYPFELNVTKSEQVNAMAFAGGKIIVFSGLDDMLVSENAMAFVLAHELGHFSNRHHLKMMGHGVVMMALLSIFGQTGGDNSQLLHPISELEFAQYSQSNESQADETALQTLNCPYGHVGGATEFFEKLKTQPDQLDFTMMHYFANHPEINLRIKQINNLTEQMGYQNKAVINRTQLE